MQLTPRYLVSNFTRLVSNESGFITEYRPVYSRQLQIYKGIDNILDFRLYNADHKPTNITNYTPKFVAFDQNNNMILEKDGTILDDGSVSSRGKFSVTVTENELLNVKQQFLTYNIYLQDSDNQKVLTYSHSNFDNDASIFVNSRTFPGPVATYSINVFSQVDSQTQEWISETIDAQPGINGNEALHTAAVYNAGYAGNLIIEATLDNQVSENTNWASISTMSFTGTETDPVPINFNGVFSYLRFRADTDPADKITKILIRN